MRRLAAAARRSDRCQGAARLPAGRRAAGGLCGAWRLAGVCGGIRSRGDGAGGERRSDRNGAQRARRGLVERLAPGLARRGEHRDRFAASVLPCARYLPAVPDAVRKSRGGVGRLAQRHGARDAFQFRHAERHSRAKSRYPLALHLLESAELLTETADFPFPVFTAGDWTLHHPLPMRPAIVRVAGAIPAGAAGVRAAFSLENDRAHPIAFGLWIRDFRLDRPGRDWSCRLRRLQRLDGLREAVPVRQR